MTASELLADDNSVIIESLVAEGKPWHKYKDELIETMDMISFCEAFHLSPKQYREEVSDEDHMKFKCYLIGKNTSINKKKK